MPTEVVSTLTGPTTQGRIWNDGTVESNPGVAVLQEVRTLDPERVRRPRPSDLFRNATAIVAHTQVCNNNSGRLYEAGPMYTTFYAGPSGNWGPGFDTSPIEADPDFGQLDLKMRLRIKDQKADLPVMFTELGQTMSMITGLATDMTEAFNKLRRGHPIDAVRRLLSDPKSRSDRALANRWLEYSFGVVPTMSDIYGVAEALTVRAHSGMDYHQAVTSRQKLERRWTSGVFACQATNDVYKRVRCRYRISSPELFELGRLGITNPASFLWEKTAWSFAIDWALNVGDYLAGFDALLAVDNLCVLRSFGQDIGFSAEFPGFEVDGGGPAKTGWAVFRQRFGADSDLSFGSPQLQSPLDTKSLGTRFANATALLRQVVR